MSPSEIQDEYLQYVTDIISVIFSSAASNPNGYLASVNATFISIGDCKYKSTTLSIAAVEDIMSSNLYLTNGSDVHT